MPWQERNQMLSNTNRTNTRASTTVRDSKGFVQIQVTDVRSNQSRTREPHLGIHVSPVHVNLSTVCMNHFSNVQDAFLKHSVRRWVCNHKRSQMSGMLFRFGPQIVQVNISLVIATHNNNPHSCHHCGRGIGPMRRRRNKTDVPMLIAPRRMIGSNHHQPCEFTLCP